MTSVMRIAPHHKHVEAPRELRDLQGWLVWRYEQHDGEAKPRKVPYWVHGGRRSGRQGSPDDRARLTTFASAKAAAAKGNFDGVGLALMPEFGITALDFDNCFDADGNLPDEIADIVNYTYSEFSPSGKGVRAFVKGDYGNRKSPSADDRFGFETFHSAGFVTFTGHILPVPDLVGYHDTISDKLDDKVAALCEKRFGSAQPTSFDDNDFMAGSEHKLNLTVEEMTRLANALDPDMGRDEWIRVGMALHHQCDGDDTGFAIWNDWSMDGGKYPGEEGLQAQWDSFTRRMGPGRKQITMATVKKYAKEAGFELPRDSAEGQEAELREAAERASGEPAQGATPVRFRILSAAEVMRHPAPGWWIKGVLPRADTVVLYGAPGSGKSFLALDMVVAIALGENWAGKRTKKGRVVFVVAEGAGSFANRVKAFAEASGINPDDLDIRFITVAPNILSIRDIEELSKAIEAAGGADLIVWDTFAQVTPGANENTSEDVGRALSNLRKLGTALEATNLIVHHSGKDQSRGARGWSGIKAAADAELEVTNHKNGVRELKVTKMKDGDDNLSFTFKLKTVDLGLDDDGDPITSCVVTHEQLEIARDHARSHGKGKTQKAILEAVEELGGKTESGAAIDAVIDRVQDNGKSLGHAATPNRSNVVRSLKGLCKLERLRERGRFVWLPAAFPKVED